MEIETLDKNGYSLIRVHEDLLQETDLAPLKAAIRSVLDEGKVNLAVSFTGGTCFYSRTIAVLVQILGEVKEFGGNLAVIHPKEGMLEMIKVVGLGILIETHTSEETVCL